jgi:hypothetical protein
MLFSDALMPICDMFPLLGDAAGPPIALLLRLHYIRPEPLGKPRCPQLGSHRVLQ